MRRARLAAFAVLVLLLGVSRAVAGPKHDNELIERLPADVQGVFSFDNAAALRASDVGRAVSSWMVEQDALANTRRAWGVFAERLGVSEVEAFDGLLGGSAVLAFARKDERAALDWIVLAAVESAMDVRMVRRTRAVPRKIVYGRSVLGLEEESFLLATLPPLPDGRSVLALAPSGAEWLLVRVLAVSAARAEVLRHDVLHTAPTDAVVRGFWNSDAPMGGERGAWEHVERWLAGPDGRRELALWATAREGTVEIGLSGMGGDAAEAPELQGAREGVLLDMVGPGRAIVEGVLERAGLNGLVHEGLEVTRDIGELVVRRGPAGIDLGARLPVLMESAARLPEGPGADNTRVVRVRGLAETPGSRAVFGPNAEMAWTLLAQRPSRPELVVAVTGRPERAIGTPTDPKANVPDQASEPQAVAIVLQAADRPSPTSVGLHGSARPRELWGLLQGTVGEGPGGRGFASLAGLVEHARWSILTQPGEVRGRIMLELRKAEAK